MTGDERPVEATPLPRIGWRTQAVLRVLLEDPDREVWPYWLNQQPRTSGGGNFQILTRLAAAGWLTTRRETGKPNARVLYRLTPAGEALAREAVKQPVNRRALTGCLECQAPAGEYHGVRCSRRFDETQ